MGEKIYIPFLERDQCPYGESMQDSEVKGQGRQKTLHVIIISIGPRCCQHLISEGFINICGEH